MTNLIRPEGLRGDIKVSELTEEESTETTLRLLMHIRQQNIRMNRQLFDSSRPVEEYYSAPDPVPAGEYEIQPCYSIPSRIDGGFFSLPVGITSAVLTLGKERIIPLYQGGATTTQTLVNLQNVGFILTDNDRRTLTFAGTPTTGFFASLFGYAFEWVGNA